MAVNLELFTIINNNQLTISAIKAVNHSNTIIIYQHLNVVIKEGLAFRKLSSLVEIIIDITADSLRLETCRIA